MSNSCFTLPPGVHWTPVVEALERLQRAVGLIVDDETVPVTDAGGKFLAEPIRAQRSNPEVPNSAVDGYAFAHDSLDASKLHLSLLDGRASAGANWNGMVPRGFALRILTGAALPDGTNTVVLDEDSELTLDGVRLLGTVRKGANTRMVGEDLQAGRIIFAAGQNLRPQDVASLVAGGVAQVRVRSRLRVGILSSGDELVQSGTRAEPGQVYDANRPMLLSLSIKWGHDPVDLGSAKDDRAKIAELLTIGAEKCDAILTSGGASAGDEDHISALLAEDGQLDTWRIAVKPGRPLALGQWRGTPVFGLPGNPVAAFVCALIFARPALRVMAGGIWTTPDSFMVPAAFEKDKKPGRTEYLRAKLNSSGHAEAFRSEGSGLTSGLTWSSGLIELGEKAQSIRKGTPVRFIPYASFGI